MVGFTDALSMGAQIPGFGPTATANFVVVGWSATVGLSFAEATTWWSNGNPAANEQPGVIYNYGISGVALNIALGTVDAPLNNVWGTTSAGLIQGMRLGSYLTVPEPTTFALAGLGTAALLVFRRRK